MGMTIDEAITWLNTDDYESKGFADAISMAITTMHKYQKIEKIVADKGLFFDDKYFLIREAIEDGNDDK